MSSCQTFDEIFSFENAEHHICKVMMSGVEGRGRSRFAVELRDPISPSEIQVVFGENNLFSGIYFCFSPCYLPDI